MILLRQPEVFRKSIEALSTFIDEGNFRFNENGLFFKATDPAEVSLVDFFMPSKSFDKFDVEPTFTGIDLRELNKITSRILPGDRLYIELTDSEMVITLDGDTLRKFSLSLIDLAFDEPPTPSINFTTIVTIKARDLKEMLKDASLFGNSVLLRTRGDKFIVEARSSYGSTKSQAKKVKIEGGKDVVSKYSLSFLTNMIKHADPDKDVVIKLKTDETTLLSYDIGNAKIKFYLAAMII